MQEYLKKRGKYKKNCRPISRKTRCVGHGLLPVWEKLTTNLMCGPLGGFCRSGKTHDKSNVWAIGLLSWAAESSR